MTEYVIADTFSMISLPCPPLSFSLALTETLFHPWLKPLKSKSASFFEILLNTKHKAEATELKRGEEVGVRGVNKGHIPPHVKLYQRAGELAVAL